MAAAGSATGCVNPRSKNKVVPSSLLPLVNVRAHRDLNSVKMKLTERRLFSMSRRTQRKTTIGLTTTLYRGGRLLGGRVLAFAFFFRPREREIEGGFPFHKLTYQRIRPSLNCNIAVRACQHPRFRAVTTALPPCFWIVGSHIQSPIQQPPSSSKLYSCTARRHAVNRVSLGTS